MTRHLHLCALLAALAACGPARGGGTTTTPILPGDDPIGDPDEGKPKPPPPEEKDPWAGKNLIRPPSALMPRAVDLPKPTRFTLANGLPVVVVVDDHLPVVAFQLAVRAGSMDEPRGKRALADVTAALLVRGTKSRSAEAIADLIAGSAGSLGTSADFESTHVACSALTQEAAACTTILADLMANPSFPDQDLQEVKDGVEQELKRIRDTPTALAGEHLENALWGDGHVRGWPATVESVRKLTRNDVVKWHAERFVPSNALLVVAGNVDPAALRKDLDKAFAAWKKKKGAVRKAPVEPKLARPVLRIVNRPDLEQAVIVIGELGVEHSAPDYYAAAVLYQALSGRLTRALREEKVSARAMTNFERWATRGTFEITAIVKGTDAPKALSVLLGELAKVKASGVSADEIARAKQELTASYPMNFQRMTDISAAVLSAELHALGDDYAREFPTRVGAVTVADVSATALKRLEAENVAVVVHGGVGAVAKDLVAALKQPDAETFDYLEPISKADRDALAAAKKLPPDPKKTEAGRKLLDQALTAKGGKEKLQKLANLRVHGRIRLSVGGQSLDGEVTRWLRAPDGLRLDVSVYNTTISMVIDKDRVWQRIGQQLQEIPPEMVPEAREGIWRDRDLVLLRHLETGTIVQGMGKEKVGKIQYDVVVIKQADGGSETRILLDAESHRIFRLIYQEGGESAYEEYDDYREVDGLWFAYKQHAEGAEQAFDVEVDEIKVNAGLPDGTFDKPR
jgi:zinc protease